MKQNQTFSHFDCSIIFPQYVKESPSQNFLQFVYLGKEFTIILTGPQSIKYLYQKKSIFTSNGEKYSVQGKWQGKHMSKHFIIKLMGLMKPNMGNTLRKYTWTKGF